MKTLLIAAVLSATLCAQEYWIQVLSVEGPVPETFIQKIERNNQPYKVVGTPTGNKVWIGSYKRYEDVQKAMNPVRCKIATDAFIVKGESKVTGGMSVEEVPKSLSVVAGTAPAKSAPQGLAVTSAKPAEKGPVPVQAGSDTAEAGSDANTTAKAEPCICICDKKALRKSEISNAVSFYKNSSDYRFEESARAMPGF